MELQTHLLMDTSNSLQYLHYHSKKIQMSHNYKNHCPSQRLSIFRFLFHLWLAEQIVSEILWIHLHSTMISKSLKRLMLPEKQWKYLLHILRYSFSSHRNSCRCRQCRRMCHGALKERSVSTQESMPFWHSYRA